MADVSRPADEADRGDPVNNMNNGVCPQLSGRRSRPTFTRQGTAQMIFRVSIAIDCMLIVGFVLGGDRLVRSGIAPKPWRELMKDDIFIPVPEVLRREILQKAYVFATRVYPDADKEMIRQRFEKYLLTSEYYIVSQAGANPGVSVPRSSGSPWVGVEFPFADRMILGVDDPPPGSKLPLRDEPLRDDEAKEQARRVLSRLLASQEESDQFEIAHSWDSQLDRVFSVGLVRTKEVKGERCIIGAEFRIRKKDGLVQEAKLAFHLPNPRIGREEIFARFSGLLPEMYPSEITLGAPYRAGKRCLTWTYVKVIPNRGIVRDMTIWDADSGELLFSEVLNGGTREKPFGRERASSPGNPEDILRNTQKNIDERVKELVSQANRR